MDLPTPRDILVPLDGSDPSRMDLAAMMDGPGDCQAYCQENMYDHEYTYQHNHTGRH